MRAIIILALFLGGCASPMEPVCTPGEVQLPGPYQSDARAFVVVESIPVYLCGGEYLEVSFLYRSAGTFVRAKAKVRFAGQEVVSSEAGGDWDGGGGVFGITGLSGRRKIDVALYSERGMARLKDIHVVVR